MMMWLQQTLPHMVLAAVVGAGESKSGNMMTVNQQLGEMTARANVIGKQAASNLKKGFSSFMAGAKELSAKATAEMQKQRNG
jgi:hypothetical protein